MQRRFLPILALLAALLTASVAAAQTDAARPYVVLVSLDGFRYDYAERYHADNLLAIGKAGAAAEGMIPSFPTVTFPNHISIVTGQYPEHHGVVGNSFWDPARQEMYSMSRSSTRERLLHLQAAVGGGGRAAREIRLHVLAYGRFRNRRRAAHLLEALRWTLSQRTAGGAGDRVVEAARSRAAAFHHALFRRCR